jgi:hypothetical protein
MRECNTPVVTLPGRADIEYFRYIDCGIFTVDGAISAMSVLMAVEIDLWRDSPASMLRIVDTGVYD